MIIIESFETFYKGIKFRSQTEAVYAYFFDTLRIEWVYEPEGFIFGNKICYRPDFYFINSKQFFEVKGIMRHSDEEKIITLAKETNSVVAAGDTGGKISLYVPHHGYIDNVTNPNNIVFNSEKGKKCFCPLDEYFRCGVSDDYFLDDAPVYNIRKYYNNYLERVKTWNPSKK